MDQKLLSVLEQPKRQKSFIEKIGFKKKDVPQEVVIFDPSH